MSDGRLLTQAEVDALPDGVVVELIWAGGNGPHRYEIRHLDGRSYALVTSDHPYYAAEQEDWKDGRGLRDRLVDLVGDDQRHTWVRLPHLEKTWPHRPLTWRSDGRTQCPACDGECRFADHEHNKQFATRERR